MGTYVCAYVGGMPPASQEDGKAVTEAWIAWFTGLGDAVIDPGNPFGPSASIGPDGTIADAGTVGLGGYSILRADDLAAALALARTCPHLAASGTVDVYETFEVM